MAELTRRSFVAGAAAGVAATAFLAASTSAADAQLVWTTADWNLAEFRKLVAQPAHAKQVYDIAAIGGGKFLNNIKNSLNGLHYGFGIPEQQIKIAAALHGPANMLNFDDFVWKKYQLGAWLKVTDPATGQPAERNIFYAAAAAPRHAKVSNNPDDENSIDQSRSIQALQSRGVQFLSCHTAAEEQARVLVRRHNLSQSPEDVVRDLMEHTLPGVLVVAAQVAAIALLQSEGRYSYITV
jgi:intracellular sulfur oxidation DsrE/DsrF family protein